MCMLCLADAEQAPAGSTADADMPRFEAHPESVQRLNLEETVQPPADEPEQAHLTNEPATGGEDQSALDKAQQQSLQPSDQEVSTDEIAPTDDIADDSDATKGEGKPSDNQFKEHAVAATAQAEHMDTSIGSTTATTGGTADDQSSKEAPGEETELRYTAEGTQGEEAQYGERNEPGEAMHPEPSTGSAASKAEDHSVDEVTTEAPEQQQHEKILPNTAEQPVGAAGAGSETQDDVGALSAARIGGEEAAAQATVYDERHEDNEEGHQRQQSHDAAVEEAGIQSMEEDATEASEARYGAQSEQQGESGELQDTENVGQAEGVEAVESEEHVDSTTAEQQDIAAAEQAQEDDTEEHVNSTAEEDHGASNDGDEEEVQAQEQPGNGEADEAHAEDFHGNERDDANGE